MEKKVKRLITILFSGMIIGFVGCGSTGELPNDEVEDDTFNQDSVVPQVQKGVGDVFKFQEYLFYDRDRINKDTYLYDEFVNGQLNYSVRTSVITQSRDPQDNLVVTETVETKIINEGFVYNNKIVSYKYDENKNVISINYPLLIQKNEEAITGIESTTCILQSFDEFLNLESKLSPNILNDLKTRDSSLNLNYSSVMHVYCGTNDNTREDIYYAYGRGKVLSISVFSDKTTYEIVSQNKFYE